MELAVARVDLDPERESRFVPSAVLLEICGHALDAAPEECCGLVLGNDEERFLRAVRITNVMTKMHVEDPIAFPKDARHAYYMAELEYLRALEEAEGRGRVSPPSTTPTSVRAATSRPTTSPSRRIRCFRFRAQRRSWSPCWGTACRRSGSSSRRGRQTCPSSGDGSRHGRDPTRTEWHPRARAPRRRDRADDRMCIASSHDRYAAGCAHRVHVLVRQGGAEAERGLREGRRASASARGQERPGGPPGARDPCLPAGRGVAPALASAHQAAGAADALLAAHREARATRGGAARCPTAGLVEGPSPTALRVGPPRWAGTALRVPRRPPRPADTHGRTRRTSAR